jgi:hypothetical protein
VRLIGVGGLPAGTAGSDVLSVLGGLSGDSSVAGVVSGPLGDLTAGLGADAGYLLLGLFGGLGPSLSIPAGPGDGSDVLTMSDEELEQWIKDHSGPVPGGEGLPVVVGDDEFVIERAGSEPVDLDRLTASLATATGAARSVSFATAGPDDALTGRAPLSVELRMADEATAVRTRQDLLELADVAGVQCEQQGDRVILRMAAFKAGSARLAESALFKRAMAGGVPNPSAAVYATSTGPVRAVGVTAGREGADTVLLARIVLA